MFKQLRDAHEGGHAMEPIGAVALWLLTEAVLPDAYTRIANTTRDKSEYKRLEAAVRQDTGARPGRRYRGWLRREQTWADLIARRADAHERLVDSLAEADARRFLRRRRADRVRAGRLVESTIAYFLPSLDPSTATAVADFRAEQRHDEVLARFDASDSFDERMELLPPTARHVLQHEHMPHSVAERLVDAVVRSEPRRLLAGFVSQPPDWLVRAPAITYRALAELASSYGLHGEAAPLYEQVAELGFDRSRNYAQAAFAYVVSGRSNRRSDLMAKARAIGPDPYIEVIEGGLDEDWEQVLAAVDRATAASDPFVAQIYSLALSESEGVNASIAFLSDVNDSNPEYAAIALRLAHLLLQRSQTAGTVSRTSDLTRAGVLAIRARDARRTWRGDSAEAVDVACRTALAGTDFVRVLQLGTPDPEGDALPEEAADPRVQFCVAQAAIASGDHDLARRAAAAVSGFRQALIMADLTAASHASQAEIDDRFMTAWSLAESDDDKVDFWLSASAAGVEPLPGADELDQRTDDLPSLTRAAQHLAHGRADTAVALLRPNRQNEAARFLLTRAYLQRDEIDEAVAEFIDMAERFNHPEHLVQAVEILVAAERLDDAVPLADHALTSVPVGRPKRTVLHEVRAVAAHNRGDWSEMEASSRAWINECGADRRRRWLLITALYNQTKTAAAWQALRQDGALEPGNSREARLWIALYAEHQPSPETLSRILSLCEQYPDDTEVRAAAVNTYFLMGEAGGAVDPDELTRWRGLVEERAADPAPEDSFKAISVPDDVEGLIEAFRPLLEPRARLLETWLPKVRKGWPYGLLATVSGRPYTTVLAHRAAGFLPIASVDPELVKQELATAVGALDHPIVADLSVLTTAWYIQDRWPQLVGAFTRVELTLESKRDSAIAAASIYPRSSETLSWDARAGRPVIHETSPDVLDRLERHLRWTNDTAASLSIRSYSYSADSQASRAQQAGAWMSAFEAAKTTGMPLWADDIGLRTLARNEGIATFGTTALLEVLASRERLPLNKVSRTINTLRDEYCVDLPLDPTWLMATAQNHEWQSGPALLAVTRPTTWANLARGFQIWQEIVNKAGDVDPTRVAVWVHAAALGIISSTGRSQSQELVPGILVCAAGAARSDPAAFADCVEAANAACRSEQVPSPTETALQIMFERLTVQLGPATAATALANLGAHLSGDDRHVLRRILFEV